MRNFITFSLRVKFLKWLLSVFQGIVQEMVSDPLRNRQAEAGRRGGPLPSGPVRTQGLRSALLGGASLTSPTRGHREAWSWSVTCSECLGALRGRGLETEHGGRGCVCKDVARACTRSLRVGPHRDQQGTTRHCRRSSPENARRKHTLNSTDLWGCYELLLGTSRQLCRGAESGSRQGPTAAVSTAGPSARLLVTRRFLLVF